MDRDRRRYKRSNASFLVTCQVRDPVEVLLAVGREEMSALMLDVGEGGVAVEVPHNIPPGAAIQLAFTLVNTRVRGDERDRAIGAVGRVVNTTPVGKGEYRLGIQFTHLTEQDRLAIHSYVQARLSSEQHS